MNTGWNDRRPVRQIDINSLKPQASIDAIFKIIDGKVIDVDLDKARTGSMYLKFDCPQTENAFAIRASNHSKIDGVHDDTINEYDGEVEINIFSKDNKAEALKFLKAYFLKVKKLPSSTKNLFTNKVEKRVLKTSYPEIVEDYLKKIKVDSSKTKKQVQEQVLAKLLKMKPKGILRKKIWAKSGGRFTLVREQEIKGIITHIASSGNQVTIGSESSKDFEIIKPLHQQLLSFFKYGHASFETYLNSIKK